MISRLGWIAVSYVTRPMFLTMTGIGILLPALDMNPVPIRLPGWSVYPGAPEARLMVHSKATLDAVRQSGRQQEVDGIDLSELWRDLAPRKIDSAGRPYLSGSPDEAFYEILEEFPNLRSVHYDGYGEPTGLDRIVSLAQLETLSLDGFGFYDLAPLRSLRNLRRLEIRLFQIQKYDVHGVAQPLTKLEGLGALASLPKLDTLVLGQRAVVNDGVLTEAGSLPHLSVLVLDLANSPRTPLTVTKAGFDALALAPTLQTLYVGGRFPEDHTELAALAKASAPRLSIFSSRHESTKTTPIMALMPCFWLAIAIGGQLSSQFLGSGSRLVPRFASSHALVGVVLSTGVIALGVARLMANGFSGPLAMAATSALVTSVIAVGAGSSTTRTFRPRGIQRLAGMSLVLLVCVVGSFFIPAFAPQTSVLSSPITVVAYTLAACGSTVLAVWTLANRAEWFSGSSSSEHILERRNLMYPEWLAMRGGSTWMFYSNRRGRHIETGLPATLNSNWRQRVGRWRLGNMHSQFLGFTLLMFGAMVVIMLVITRLFGIPLPGGVLATSTNIMPLSYTLLFGLGQVVRTWRARLMVLPLEFLRPCSRRAMQRELAAAFALDLVPLAILFAIVVTLKIHLDTSRDLSWRWVPLSFLYFLALGGLWVLAGSALAVLVRRFWLSIVLLVFPFFQLVYVFSMIELFWFQSGPRDFLSSFMTPGLILASFGLPLLTGAILCWVLWRRWLRIEIGQSV